MMDPEILKKQVSKATLDYIEMLEGRAEEWKYEAMCEHDHAVEFMKDIELLRAELAKVTAERDALKPNTPSENGCRNCLHSNLEYYEEPCASCFEADKWVQEAKNEK